MFKTPGIACVESTLKCESSCKLIDYIIHIIPKFLKLVDYFFPWKILACSKYFITRVRFVIFFQKLWTIVWCVIYIIIFLYYLWTFKLSSRLTILEICDIYCKAFSSEDLKIHIQFLKYKNWYINVIISQMSQRFQI